MRCWSCHWLYSLDSYCGGRTIQNGYVKKRHIWYSNRRL